MPFNAANTIAFISDPNNQPTSLGNASTNEIDLIDPDYEYPQSLRGNIGYDRDLLGLTVGAEFLFNKVVKDIGYQNLNIVPAGTTLTTSRSARVFVLRSGAPPDEAWVTESVHVRRDYERLYGEVPARARGVAVLTDADQTKSRAVGDYGPFRVCPDRPR